jgi:hypothetical protein
MVNFSTDEFLLRKTPKLHTNRENYGSTGSVISSMQKVFFETAVRVQNPYNPANRANLYGVL